MPRPRRTRSNSKGGGSAAQYRTIVGFMPFDPDEVTTEGGDEIRRIRINSGSLSYSATIWDRHEDIELRAGMVVAVNGRYTKTEGDDGTTYHNLSCTQLAVLGEDESEDTREKPKATKRSKPKAAAGRSRRRAPEPDDEDDDDDDDEPEGDDDF